MFSPILFTGKCDRLSVKIYGTTLRLCNVKVNQSAEGAGGLGIIRSNKVGETE